MIRKRDCILHKHVPLAKNDSLVSRRSRDILQRRSNVLKSPKNTSTSTKGAIIRRRSSKKRKFIITRVLFTGIVIYGVVYMDLICQISSSLFQMQRTNISRLEQKNPEMNVSEIDTLRWFENERVIAQKSVQKRRNARIKRTSPPILDDVTFEAAIIPYSYSFLRSDEEEGHKESNTDNPGVQSVAEETLHQCGMTAREAAKMNPTFYPSKHMIRNQSVIIISGIMGRIGFNLALQLSSCNLKVIIAVDGMYHNDSAVRLNQLRQLEILYSSVPQVNRPFIMAYDGANPKASYHSSFQRLINEMNGELDYSSFSPTHVVHLASVETITTSNIDDTADIFEFRQSMIGLEHLLSNFKTLDSDIHFVLLVSNLPSTHEKNIMYRPTTSSNRFSHLTHIMEEAMVRHFANRNANHTYVTLRIPYVYGPFGEPGLFDFDIANYAVNNWAKEKSLDNFFEKYEHGSYPPEVPTQMLYVDDVSDAIISAMQFSDNRVNHVSIDLTSQIMVSPLQMSQMIQNCMPPNTCHGFQYGIDQKDISHLDRLGWTPKWHPEKGIKHLIAWHLDQIKRTEIYKNATTETGSSFLKRNNETLCDFDDISCLKGKPVLPCASECSDQLLCRETPFDDVVLEARRLTTGCEFVIITSQLSNFGSKIQMQSPDDGRCSLAFIPKSSALSRASRKNRGSTHNMISYNGWTLIFVDIDSEQISSSIRYLLKLSPALFMSDQVKAVLYLSEDSHMNLILDDVEFIQSLLSKKKNLDHELLDDEMKRYKYVRQNEDSEALLLIPTIRIEDPSRSHIDGSDLPLMKKYSFADVASILLEEDPRQSRRASSHIAFYNQVRTFFNECDFTTDCKKHYKLDPHHWIRSTWIVHNLQNLHSRRLRCEWYNEHVKWLDSNDALSFSHVIARLQVEKFHSLETMDDERYEMLMQQNKKEYDVSTDQYQWHNVFDDQMVRTIDLRGMMIERNLFGILKEREHKYTPWKDLLH